MSRIKKAWNYLFVYPKIDIKEVVTYTILIDRLIKHAKQEKRLYHNVMWVGIIAFLVSFACFAVLKPEKLWQKEFYSIAVGEGITVAFGILEKEEKKMRLYELLETRAKILNSSISNEIDMAEFYKLSMEELKKRFGE